MKALHWFTAIVLSTGLYACASTEIANDEDVNQNKIHQRYSVKLSENGVGCEAEAQLRFGGELGTTLMITGGREISLNGNGLTGDEGFLQGWRYTLPVKNTEKAFSFTYTNSNDEVFVNEVNIEPITLGNIPANISCLQGAEIKWDGAPVGPNETVNLHIYDVESNSVMSLNTSAVGANSITITPKQMANLVNGMGSISASREVNKDLDQGNSEGGSIYGKYESNDISIEIVDGKAPTPATTGGGGSSI